MKTLTSLLILTTLVLSASQLSTSSTVLDFQGNPVRTYAAYHISVHLSRIIGGLELRALNGSYYAGFSPIEVDPGVPVVFLPHQPGKTLKTGDGYRFRVRFLSTPSGVANGEWVAEKGSGYVTTRGDGDDNSYFSVSPVEGGGYGLRYCGLFPIGKNACAPVGTDEERFLRISTIDASAFPLKVDFARTGYVDETGKARSAQ